MFEWNRTVKLQCCVVLSDNREGRDIVGWVVVVVLGQGEVGLRV